MTSGVVNKYLVRYMLVGITIVPMLITQRKASGQVVAIGPSDPKYCEKVEQVSPNLVLSHSAHVYGVITDFAKIPIANKQVLLKTYQSSSAPTTARETTTDDRGQFDLGEVNSGSYRLLASSTRAFRQPEKLECPVGDQCNLVIRLVAPTTDGADSVCPVK
jgi:hypothetical protein